VATLLSKKAAKVLKGDKGWYDMGTEVTGLMWIA